MDYFLPLLLSYLATIERSKLMLEKPIATFVAALKILSDEDNALIHWDALKMIHEFNVNGVYAELKQD